MPFAFHDLPADAFPFVIECLCEGVVVRRLVVPDPRVVDGGSLTFECDGPVAIRLIYADGTVHEYVPLWEEP